MCIDAATSLSHAVGQGAERNQAGERNIKRPVESKRGPTMKENVLDVLMFLFENYLYDEPEEAPDRDSLEENLHQAGFTNVEIEKAFNWLDGLADQRHQPDLFQDNTRPVRVYVDSEIARLDTECRDFLMYLENIGIIDAQRRELVLDRVLALETDEITLEDVKWVVLMVLFNQPGQEANFAWMEDLMFDSEQEYRH
jgi:Smg protein